jgi:methyl-accepting chemotaxis protein
VINPTKASKNYLGKDCMICHQVPENSVLGVVSHEGFARLRRIGSRRNRLKIGGVAIVALGALLVIIYLLCHFVTASA